MSLDIGCVRITEQFLTSDPPAPEELANAVATVRDLIADVPRVVPGATEAATLVGLAGTITTVAAIELGLPEYDPERIHHFHLTRAAAEDVFRTLATENAEQRAHNPGLEPGRVDVIVGGAIVLVNIIRRARLRRSARVGSRHPRRPRSQPQLTLLGLGQQQQGVQRRECDA